MDIPDFILELANDHFEHKPWVNTLPDLIARAREKWKLKIGDPFIENASCSFVAPCKINHQEIAILKIGLPHDESLHEIDGLRLLDGSPTVMLLDDDPETGAMLLEACVPGIQLKHQSEPYQDEIICMMLKKIWSADFQVGPFRPLSGMVENWNRETYQSIDKFPDTSLAKAGCKMKETLINSSNEEVFLVTDLHAGNVLSAQRNPWLAIDIKPYYGDRTYDLTQHLLNCKERLSKFPRETIDGIALLAGVDPARLRDWMFARLAAEGNGINQSLALQTMY